MKGILQEVSGNVVKIDSKYYDASQVIHFLPKSTNIEVEFSVDNNNKLTYIKPTGIQKTPQGQGLCREHHRVLPQRTGSI